MGELTLDARVRMAKEIVDIKLMFAEGPLCETLLLFGIELNSLEYQEAIDYYVDNETADCLELSDADLWNEWQHYRGYLGQGSAS